MRIIFNILFVVLVTARLSFAAVGYDTSSASFVVGLDTITIANYAVTGSNILMLCGSGTDGGVVPTVTFNSVSVPELSSMNPYANYYAAIYGLAGVSGTHDVVLTSSVSAHIALSCTTLTGVNQGTPTGTAVQGNFVGSPASVTVPTNGLGWDFSTAMAAFDCTSGTNPGAGQTSRITACSNYSITDNEIMIYSSTRATTGTFTWDEPGCCPVVATIAVPVNPTVVAPTVRGSRRYWLE